MKNITKRILFLLIFIIMNLSIINVYGVNLEEDSIKATRGKETINIKIIGDKPQGTIGGELWCWDYEVTSQVYAKEIISLDFEVYSGYGLNPNDGGTIKQVRVTNDEYVKVETEIEAEYEGVNSAKVHADIHLLKASSETKFVTIQIGDDESTLDLSIKIPKVGSYEESAAGKLENAYKTIPGADAEYSAIKNFIESDTTNNNMNSFNTVDLDTLKQWKQTIDGLNGQWYKDDGTYKVITARIKELEGQQVSNSSSSYKNEIVEEYNYSIGQIKIAITDEGTDRDNVTFIDVLDNINSYIPTDDISDADADKFESKVSTILTIVTNIGMILAVLMVAIIGVKYMLGSIEEKAEYKKDMIPYLIGAILLFGISTIMKVLQQLGQSINNI